MRTLTTILLLLAAPLLTGPVLGQQQGQRVAGVEQVQTLLADEQVRLVHSQPWYAAGERLWFKAFINKTSNRPPSRALYVELQDANGTTLINQRLVVEEGIAYGDMLLPSTLPSGSYTLLATTNWLKNFSDKQQHREQLLIVNSREVVALRHTKAVSPSLHVQFFPEANSLLAGVTTKVAVVVTNAAGIGIATKGIIADTAGNTVTSFQTEATGVGVFELPANAQAQYVAQVQAQGYKAQRAELPKPKQNGLALSVKGQSPEAITVGVHSTMPWTYTLLATSGDQVVFTHSAKTSGIVRVPWQATPGKSLRLLLLNPAGLIEAEQLVLPAQLPTGLQVKTDRPQYGTRQQVKVTLQGIPERAKLAVAVSAQRPGFHRPLAAIPTSGMQEELLLVHAADEGLWKDVLAGKTEATHELEPFVAALPRTGIAEPFASTNFSTRTDTAFVQALPESVVAYAEKHHTRAHLQEIYGLTEPHAVAPLHRLPADRVFKLDDYITFNNVEEAIKEVTTNVRMVRKKGRQTVRLLYVAPGTKRMMKQEPLYLVDGVIVEGMEEILALDLNDIASIEIAWSEEKLYAANLGHLTDNGLFAVYTKSGEARERLKEKGRSVLYGQYNQPKAFVATSNAVASTIPDFRQLVYWEPQLQAGANGEASFTFFTSDEIGTFQIEVLGQTAEGIPLRGTTQYEVRPAN
ncbi:hypothetical protein [Pontibacter roseus]|uniref:hypothetical protein n=1 Tax=Pontibacter roseus TaxID=336989 RepID=UPI001FDFDFBA|nr:hypothetical protein [Pontibacter roseus]